jgi:hypothetical protein
MAFLFGILVLTFLAVQVPAQSFLTNGLVAYYQFNGNANDASGNGNNGVVLDATLTTDRFGNANSAYEFGNSSSISFANPPDINPLGSFAYSFWINASSVPSSPVWLIDRTTSTTPLVDCAFAQDASIPNNAFEFVPRYDDGSGVNGTAGTAHIAGGVLIPGTWQQAVMVREYGSAFKLYIDGQLVASAVDDGNSLTPPIVKIGQHETGSSQYFGAFDDFRIYNGALDSNEVAQLYTIESHPLISITSQPASTTNNLGGAATFTVGVTNVYPVTYQWTKDGITLPYGTNATLTVTNLQTNNIGNYAVTITDIYRNTVSSSNALLTLNGVDSGIWYGLVGYYPFNGNANDASGNGNNGVANGATLTTDRFGNANSAYEFGNSSSISFTNPPDINPLGSFAYSFWINATSVPSSGVWLIDRTTATTPLVGCAFAQDASIPNNAFELVPRYDDGSGVNGTSGTAHIAGGVLAPGTWQQAVMVREYDSAFKLYIDGQLVASAVDDGKSLTPPTVKIGEHESGSSQYFGAFDDFRIYNHALYSNDVAALYALESVSPNLQIIQNLTNSYVLYGQNATIGVSVSSQTPVSYQWYFVSANNADAGQAGAYAETISGFVYGVVVTNGGFGYGNIPNISFAGGGGSGVLAYATVSKGMVAGITVTNAGSGYTNVPAVLIDPPDGYLYGQTNNTLTISNANLNSLGNYYVVVANSTGSVTSSVVNLTLLCPPSITNQPQDQIVNAFGAGQFDVGASGTSPLAYQWLFQGTNLPGADAGPLVVTNVTPQNLGPYAVIITNNYGSVTSSVANLYMYPYLETPFSGAITYWGQTNILSVGAWGSGGLSYQWYLNGAAISGATSSNLVLSGIQFTNAGLYTVVVSSPYGSVTNTPEQVVVNPANISLGLFAGVIIQGTVGYTYLIQYSTNLTDTNGWIDATNLTLQQPVEIWDDNSVDTHTTAGRYYRIEAPQ